MIIFDKILYVLPISLIFYQFFCVLYISLCKLCLCLAFAHVIVGFISHKNCYFLYYITTFQGGGIVVSISAYHVGGPGLIPVRPTCFRKVIYDTGELSVPCCRLLYQRLCRVESCQHDSACEGSPAIRLVWYCVPSAGSHWWSVRIYPVCAEQER